MILVLTGLGVASIAGASGNTPTPTPIEAPTVAPGTSRIGLRFLLNGVPVELSVIPLPDITADGVLCPFGGLDEPVVGPEFAVGWPLGGTGIPPECAKGPPTTITFGVQTEVGTITRQFVWTGDDVIVDVELSGASPTASPTPTSLTPTPGQLPTTGGPVESGGSGNSWRLAALLLAGTLAFAAGMTIALRRNDAHQAFCAVDHWRWHDDAWGDGALVRR
ncbi:MAG: hypothetical protein WD904_08175 [Dehalococcoidia bacterium]